MLPSNILLLVIVAIVYVTSCGSHVIRAPPGYEEDISSEAVLTSRRTLCVKGGGDKKGGCGYWKNLGYCDKSSEYRIFMEMTCPASCDLCQARPTPPPVARLVKVNKQECLAAHNAKRALHGADPLTWDDSLTQAAGNWALTLARSNKFVHAPYGGQGENMYYIAKVSGTPVTCKTAVQAWYNEVADYPFDSPPQSIFKVKPQIGHFTQLVWRSTRRVGVAIASIKRGFWYKAYIIARYTPPGNYNGEFAQQVGRPITNTASQRKT